VTQDVLRSVAGAAKKLEYDPRRGSFRGWLFTVVRNRLRDFWAGQARQCQGTGDPDADQRLQELPAPEEDQQAEWEQEYEQQLFHWAAAQVRADFQDSTWQAFWQTAVQGKSGKVVAKGLGMTVAAVYLAKARVITRLKVNHGIGPGYSRQRLQSTHLGFDRSFGVVLCFWADLAASRISKAKASTSSILLSKSGSP